MTEERTVFDIDLTWEKINSARTKFEEDLKEETRITREIRDAHEGIMNTIYGWYGYLRGAEKRFDATDSSSFIISEDDADGFARDVERLYLLHGRLEDLHDQSEEMEAHPCLHLATWHIAAGIADRLLVLIDKIRKRIFDPIGKPWYFVDSLVLAHKDLDPYVMEMAHECFEDSSKDVIVSFLNGYNERLADLISTVTLLPTEMELIIDEDRAWAASDTRDPNDHGCQLLGIGTDTAPVVFAIKATYPA